MRTKFRLFGTVFCSVLLLNAARGSATTIYNVTAWIDTTDYLIIHGSTLQWEHTTSGSPAGTHTSPQPTVISSSLDGVQQMNAVDWDQTWPSPLPSDAFSSVLNLLTPALPTSGNLDASIINISGRGTPSIFQEPLPSNNDTLIVQFTDGFDGAAFLDAQITVAPEPSCAALSAIVVMGLLRRPRSGRCAG
jgi:hypothetical protein